MDTLYKNCLAFILTITFMCMAIHCHAQDWNVDLLKNINPQHPDSRYWKQISNSAYILPATVCLGTLVYVISTGDEKTKARAIESFISFSAGTLISELLKNAINERRPGDKYPGVIFPGSPTHGKSFPSGHTVLAFSTVTTLALEYKKWYITVPAFLWAGLVGYSRLYLGMHYPTDVLAGGILGVGSGFASHWLNKKLCRNYNHKNR